MKTLLISGAQSVGKSNAIYRLANQLISKGFVVVSGTLPATFNDFKIVLEGTNKADNNKIRIIINSPTDTVDIINDFKIFHDNNGVYDILISSVRDDDFWPRKEFFTIMNLKVNSDLLEIPLAKITRRGSNFFTALKWYVKSVDKLIENILQNKPFNL